MFQTKLIKLYCAVCDNSSIIERENQRQSNNFRPQFTDEECITVYLWGISQRRFKLKDIYNYIKNHLLEWFPKLPSYQAFSRRCNALASAMRALSEVWMNTARASLHSESVYLVDSCPIMLAHRSRACHAKVASDLCAVSYHSTRKEWYYGVKLHAFATRRPKKLPLPAAMMFSKADVHDLTAAKQMTQDMDFLSYCTVMGSGYGMAQFFERNLRYGACNSQKETYGRYALLQRYLLYFCKFCQATYRVILPLAGLSDRYSSCFYCSFLSGSASSYFWQTRLCYGLFCLF